MALDESKLENVRRKDGKFTARCPACAEKGGDRKGEHLVVYDDGAYHCVATNGESRHSKRIFALAGKDARGGIRATAPVLKKWGIRTIPGWNPLEW